MKRNTIAVWVAVLALGAGAPAYAATQSHDSHSHEAHAAPAKLTLDQGRKWATDEPLRRHMGEIRSALDAKRHAIHKGTLDADASKQLGVTIEKGVAGIVADCKLPPAADANLHLVVADLVQAADILQGRSTEKAAHGATKAVHALNQYGKYFDHPGWKPVN